MEAFHHIIGHQQIKRYFTQAVASGKVAHSYIFEGPRGVGKKIIAMEVAKMLLCESTNGDTPCGNCKACHMIEVSTHPDVIKIDKDTKVTKIETIREQVVKSMDIKPYKGPYKMIIINEADTITIEGQNAMLKTIEEPPLYGIIILITENMAKLLPTIKSRCIHMRFNPLSSKQMTAYLQRKNLTPWQLKLYTQFAQGSIGVANTLIEDLGFLELREKSITYLEKLEKADLIQMYQLVQEICENKEVILQILDFWTLWYRDIAILKSTGSERLYYLDYQSKLLDMSYKLTYNKISTDIEAIKKSKIEINQNIYMTFIIENLLLKLKERKK